LRVHRLGQVQIGPAFVAHHLVADLGAGRGDDDAHVWVGGPQPARQTQAILVGQVQVDHIHIRHKTTTHVVNVFGHGHTTHVVPLLLQESQGGFAQCVVVLDHQDFQGDVMHGNGLEFVGCFGDLVVLGVKLPTITNDATGLQAAAAARR